MARARRRRPLVRLLGTVLALALVLAVGAALAWRFLALPQTTGELVVDGLDAPVRVVRDRHGIPHVLAESPRDAFRALGLLHAQDRLWQLEMNRRIVHGALAEVLGADALGNDRFLRTLGIRRNAERIEAALDAATREALQAYADGINAWIEQVDARPWQLSPEFLLLGVRPQRWEPADSIGWATMMAWDLSGNHGVELLRLALPGLPYVVVGRSDRFAWGFTNTAPDSQDLYLERVHPDDPGRYRTPDGWAAFETRTETIRVKGAAEVEHVVRSTRHGPVVSDVLASGRSVLETRGLASHVLSFAWTMLSPEDRTVHAGLGMNTATDWASFREALRDFRGPQQNVVFADVDGRIAFVAAGAVPLRRPDNELRGSLPAPGWDARYDWAGTIPFDELPQREQPDDGLLVTANQRIAGDDYPHYLGGEWALPYRSDRITAKLRTLDVHDVDAFAALQADVGSPAVGEMLPHLLGTQARSERAQHALELLRRWADAADERTAPAMLAERPEPLIAVAWIDRLRRAVFEDEVGAELFVQLERHRMRHNPLRDVFERPDLAHWCDDRTTPEVEACDEMLARSLDAVVDELSRRLGGEPESWQWGRLHPAVSTHRPFGRHWLLSKWFDLRVPSGGDPSTINLARHDPWDPAAPFENRWAAGYRAIYDLADPDASRFIHSTGQSGHRLSPHYGDLVEPWSKVRYLPMVSSRERIERDAAAVLVLRPATASN